MFGRASGKEKRQYSILDPGNARDAALYALLKITESGYKSGAVLRDIFAASSGRTAALTRTDRAFIEHIVMGTLARIYTLDAVIKGFSRAGSGRQRPLIRGILRLSVYQLLYMDRIPDSAVCNEAVKLAKLHHMEGLSGYVNGLLRSVVRDLDTGSAKLNELLKDDCARYSLPGWIYKRISSEYGKERAETIFRAWLTNRPNTIRINMSRINAREPEETVAASLSSEGFEISRINIEEIIVSQGLKMPRGALPVMYELSGGNIAESSAFKNGWITVQDVSSALVASYAAPAAGDTVIDVCAAPGGKSLAIADITGDKAFIDARDISGAKTGLIEENVSRCGFSSIKIKVSDATVPEEDSFCRADILIADLPCSGLGVLAKKPDIKINLKPYSIEELALFQRDILINVSSYIKPRGKLVYSTCTLTSAENNQNTLFIKNELGYRLLSEELILPGAHNDGFYIAVFEKRY